MLTSRVALKSFPAHVKRLSTQLKPCVIMMAHSQCEPDESWHSSRDNPSGKKNSIDGKLWSLSIFGKLADLILWAHTIDEPILIITQPPQACMVGAGHDGCVTTSASFMALMQRSQEECTPPSPGACTSSSGTG